MQTAAFMAAVCCGAENGARTRDLNLGKVALYQLSYFRKTLLLSVGTAKIDTFFETPNFFAPFLKSNRGHGVCVSPAAMFRVCVF